GPARSGRRGKRRRGRRGRSPRPADTAWRGWAPPRQCRLLQHGQRRQAACRLLPRDRWPAAGQVGGIRAWLSPPPKLRATRVAILTHDPAGCQDDGDEARLVLGAGVPADAVQAAGRLVEGVTGLEDLGLVVVDGPLVLALQDVPERRAGVTVRRLHLA